MNPSVKNIFTDRYDSIKSFLQTPSMQRTNEELIDMRNTLEGFPFFTQFTKYVLIDIICSTKSQDFISMCRHLQVEHFENECTLFSQGDAADKFYMVLRGQVFIWVRVADQEKQVGQLGVGGAFGELALLFNSERNASIKVDAHSELMVLHKDDFKHYMKFQSSDYANQAFSLINSMDEFKNLEFPDRVRLASKMDFKSYPSNHIILHQGQPFNSFFVVMSGLVKFYRDVEFNTTNSGSINFDVQRKTKSNGKSLKIEIDEVGPGRYFGEYELISHRPSQYTAVTHMPCSVFTLPQFDFQLMSTQQLQSVCVAAKPYPNDEDIRQVFLEGVQWRVFRKQLVQNLKERKPQARDPTTLHKERYNKDMKMFAINTLTFDGLLKNFIQDSQSQVLKRPAKQDMLPNTTLFGTTLANSSPKKSFFNAESSNLMKSSQQISPTKQNVRKRTGPTTSKTVLPKINPKVGSSVYNILISY